MARKTLGVTFGSSHFNSLEVADASAGEATLQHLDTGFTREYQKSCEISTIIEFEKLVLRHI